MALTEMNKLFRHLFPVVPDKAHYIWKTSHLGGSMILKPGHHTTAYEAHHYQRPSPVAIQQFPGSEALSSLNSREQQYVDISPANSDFTNTNPAPVRLSLTKLRPAKTARRPPPLGKRGPECMRKCIAQGVLHPVQCHSLC